MGFKETLEGIIAKKRNASALDLKVVNCLIARWRSLRKFYAPRRRAELAMIFVAFCEGRINDNRFRHEAEAFQSPKRRTTKKSTAFKPKGRYFWKPA